MGESFQVIFNSQSPNVINDGITTVLYNVNWGAFLPKKYKKFHCYHTFKSKKFTDLTNVNIGLLSINLGRMSCYNGDQMSTHLGIVYPVNLTGNLTNIGYYRSAEDTQQACVGGQGPGKQCDSEIQILQEFVSENCCG
jgi:hypothetical protein